VRRCWRSRRLDFLRCRRVFSLVVLVLRLAVSRCIRQLLEVERSLSFVLALLTYSSVLERKSVHPTDALRDRDERLSVRVVVGRDGCA
jgi:hypothetical protein